MPLIELSTFKMLILIFILAPSIQVLGAVIGRKMPLKSFSTDKWLYRERKWERKGAVYKKVGVHKWKKYLPDGAKFFKGDFTKKKMLAFDEKYLELFITESCRAEFVHWAGMIPFLLFFLLIDTFAASLMVAYSIIVNLPCIIAQRYNRPRFKSLLEKLQAKKSYQN